MKKIIVFSIVLIITSVEIYAQKYFTRSGNVSFHSKALLEDIDAYNSQGTFVLDEASRQVQMAVLIKAFQFEKALMQEHFNENYMESDQFPKAIFKGKIISPKDFTLESADDIPVCNIEGTMTIHGVSKAYSTSASFVLKDGKVHASAIFPIVVADYNIRIPSIVKDKIAKEVEVKIDLQLERM